MICNFHQVWEFVVLQLVGIALVVMQFQLFVFSVENDIANVIFTFWSKFCCVSTAILKMIFSLRKSFDTLQTDSFRSQKLTEWNKFIEFEISIENISENEVL